MDTITQVEWYSAPRHDLRPLAMEREGRAAGERLRQVPSKRRGRSECGFDAAGVLLFEREWVGDGHYDTLFEYGARQHRSFRFGPWEEMPLVNVIVVDVDAAGTPASAVQVSRRSVVREDYHWSAGQLIAVDVSVCDRVGDGFGPPRAHCRQTIQWDGDRVHEVVAEFAHPDRLGRIAREVIYREPTRA